MSTDIKEVEARLTKAILAQKAKGIGLCDKEFQTDPFCLTEWRLRSNRCRACAVECLLLEERPPRILEGVYRDIDGAVAYTLGIAVPDVWALIFGFDNSRRDASLFGGPFYLLGKRLRTEFLEGVPQ